MSRRAVTVAAVLVVLLTMVAVWGVGAGRDAASATPAADAPTTVPPTPAEPLTASEPSRPTTIPTTAGGTGTPAGGTATTTAATPTPPPDFDGDGIPDDRDACPTRPETVNGFRDGDGCPDVVATTRAS